jgi:hypothetical protein
MSERQFLGLWCQSIVLQNDTSCTESVACIFNNSPLPCLTFLCFVNSSLFHHAEDCSFHKLKILYAVWTGGSWISGAASSYKAPPLSPRSLPVILPLTGVLTCIRSLLSRIIGMMSTLKYLRTSMVWARESGSGLCTYLDYKVWETSPT